MTPVIVVIAIVVVAVAAGAALARRGKSRDGVDSFRRQIDALSPEARRPTIDQVHRAGRGDEESTTEQGDGAGEDDDDGT